MAEPLKNIYSPEFFQEFNEAMSHGHAKFNAKAFLTEVYSDGWEDLELKGRMRRISSSLRPFLNSDYKESLSELKICVKALQKKTDSEFNYEFMFIPDYVEVFGLEDLNPSVKAFTSITQFSSCEFAVRPFIATHPQKMYKQMIQWAVHKDKLVRRLASEGYRPRLPWAMALPELKIDPSPLLEMLELLKDDEAETVRKSVANNLNDISKDHPKLILELAQKWIGRTKQCDWVLKHGCRTLLKKGMPEAMELFGLSYNSNITHASLTVSEKSINMGDSLEFSFNLVNSSKSYVLTRLEYAIYYQKANGTLSKKVYKISEKEYAGNSEVLISRKQPFKPISTRKFHAGKHQLALIINGKEFERYDFNLSI
ncbi:MAG: DNA alkylation repair protein [Flavobacteriales bacterium]